MIQTTTVTIEGQAFTVGQLPAHLAFETACVVAEWRARSHEAFGAGVGSIVTTARDGADPMAAEIPVGRMLAGQASANRIRAQMLRDPEYRRLVWDQVLGLCTGADGVPVLRPDWTTRFAGEGLGVLFALHEAAIEHSCGPFLRSLGVGRLPPAVSDPQQPAG